MGQLNLDFLYWTDWNEHTLMRMSKSNHRDVIRFGPKVFNKLCDVDTVAKMPLDYKIKGIL